MSDSSGSGPISAGRPRDLVANPRLSTWLQVGEDGTVWLRVGKVELGQGIHTALIQLAADELDVPVERVRLHPTNTAAAPDEGFTAGSMSIADAGPAVRQVCAHVRTLFRAAAARAMGVDPEAVEISDGVFRSGPATCSYGDLASRVDLCRDVDFAVPVKPIAELRLTGQSVSRVDLADKVVGRPRYITDLVLPDQLWGRVVRPPSPDARLVGADPASARAVPGVQAVVVDGSFLGVVADDEHRADIAAANLREAAAWHERPTLPDEDDLPGYLRRGPATTFTVVDSGDQVATAAGVRTVRASYGRPFLAHASLSPSCGVALWDGERLRVWSHSQGVFPLRRAIAAALTMDENLVEVEHVEAAGCYGHNGADDAAFDAVLLARAVPGRPVHVRWSRQDELAWSPFGSAMVIDISAGLDDRGCLLTWTSEVYSQGHTSRPGYAGAPGLLAAAHLADPRPLPAAVDPPPERGSGSTRNAVPGYRIPACRVRGHRLTEVALRSSSLRTLGAFANVFAIESMLDECALAAGSDPLDYRLAHLDDDRGRAVLLAVAERSGWRHRNPGADQGFGIGYARYKGFSAYCAAVAQVDAVTDVRVRRLWLAVDVGRVVNPDGVRNQIEGGAVQATSWTLRERVRFDRYRVTSLDWERYPILRFSEVPEVDVTLLDRPDEPSVGAGEAAAGPTAAAIGNAVADALGVRVRTLPITAEQVIAAIGG